MTAKPWGGCLGRKTWMRLIMSSMRYRAAQMQLSIEVGSDPITGSVSVGAGAPQQFSGWIELVAAIESARDATSNGAGRKSGVVPWGEAQRDLVS